MSIYQAPLREMLFVIERVLQAPVSWSHCKGFEGLALDDVAQVLTQAERFAVDVLEPTNSPGDLQGCRMEQGEVQTPAGYAQAYRAFVDGGWPSLACHEAWGGQGLPQLLNAALYEMLLACNHAWTMYPALLHGAYETLHAHASESLRKAYLPSLCSGDWLAAMALTEPQAGSDLGLVRTQAVPQPDGSLRVSGQKIFISGGEHDLTDNIVHLVLCRLPDAPAGSKGLSLALVPKVLPDGRRNAVFCDGLERKMGIKGSATCQMRYEAATGWLVGEPGRGLAAMFVMMNAARLHVALQGLAHLERATQRALAYAHERLQMRAPLRPHGQGGAAADPIAAHPAMRRVLWRLKAVTSGLRVIAFKTAMLLDEAEQHASPARREQAAAFAGLLTPVAKAFMTRLGFEGSSEALQVFGGHGYVHDHGVEQQLRDARIAMIYEGTNEIQAIDLLLRKVLPDGGEKLEQLLDELGADIGRDAAAMREFALSWRDGRHALREAVALLRRVQHDEPERAHAVADDFLAALGHLLLCWAWGAIARAAAQETDPAFAQEQLQRARFGLQWVLPEGELHWLQVLANGRTLPMLSS